MRVWLVPVSVVRDPRFTSAMALAARDSETPESLPTVTFCAEDAVVDQYPRPLRSKNMLTFGVAWRHDRICSC